jgi:hypothetical protein
MKRKARVLFQKTIDKKRSKTSHSSEKWPWFRKQNSCCIGAFACIFSWSIMISPIFGQTAGKEDILRAINDGATYAADVLLDESGQSRCDYNILQGKWYAYEPAWHTGQIIYGLVRAYEVTKNEKYLNAAKKAGDWWVGLEIKDHPKLAGMVRAAHGDYVGDYLVFATVSDGTAGLFNLFRVTGNRRYADVPTRAGEWMLQNMWIPEHGMFYDTVDPSTGEVLKHHNPFFPDVQNPPLNMLARPNNEGSLYKDMYLYTNDERFKEVFLALCQSLVEKQGENGLWMDYMPNSKEEGTFHPRFNLWYAESLLEGYELNGDRRFLEAAKKTALFYTKFQQGDGTFYYKNYVSGGSNRNSICGSAVAFAGLVWLRLQQYGAGDEFKDNVERSVTWIVNNRYAPDHPDENLAGAFLETRTRRPEGKLWITMRDIATSFGLRFLADYYSVHLIK